MRKHLASGAETREQYQEQVNVVGQIPVQLFTIHERRYIIRVEKYYKSVAIIISKTAAKCLIKWKPYSKRLMSTRFKTSYGYVIFLQCYAPTNDAKDTDRGILQHVKYSLCRNT